MHMNEEPMNSNSIKNDMTSAGSRRPAPIRALMFAAVFFSFLLSTVAALAQTSTGNITGYVEDPHHKRIPGAAVTIRNVDTNQEVDVKTDQDGLYGASALQPGAYVVLVAKQGFEDVKVTAVSVNISDTSSVNVQMKVGTARDTVTVAAEAQLLDSTSPTITTDVPTEITQGIPLPERSALEAIMLAPGVQGDPQYDMGIQSENPPIYTQPTSPGVSLSVGGGRPGSALLLVDGVDLTQIGYARVGITFSGDDVQQITVMSGGISSQFGRSGGGVINQASKGGTVNYHGKLAYRHLDPFFEATTYGQGTINTGSKIVPITQDVHQNMFTGTFGGPVPLSFLKNNTFFFASYEPLRGGSKVFSRSRVPTPAELSGDFSNAYTLLNTSILSSQGYAAAEAAPRVGGLDYQFPLNSAGFPSGARYASSASYVPIPNYNLSAQLSQNPFAQYVLSQFPTPAKNGINSPYIDFYDSNADLANDGTNALIARGVQNIDNRYNIRVDHNFGGSDHIFGRYTNVPVSGVRYSFIPPTSPLDNQPDSIIHSMNALLDYTHIIGGTATNDIRVSWTRMNYLVLPAPSGLTADFAAKYGLTASEEKAGFPSLGIDTGTYGSSTGGNDGGLSVNEEFSVGDDFSKVIRNHTLTIGGEFRSMQLDRLPDSGIYGGGYSFSTGTTNNGSSGGNATASFILGSINSLTLAPVQEFYYRFKYGAAYIMDNWRVAPKLTLNIGLRYNLETPRTEKYGLQGSFLPNVTGTLGGVAATGAFAFSGNNGLPNTLYPTNFKGFEPRVGFAYLVTPSMTLRGSANFIHAPMTGVTNSNIPALTPSSLTIGGASGGTNTAAWVNYITNPVSLPSTGIPGVLKGPSPFFSYGTGFLPYVSQSNVVPYVENWSLSMQYQLSNTAMVQAAYVGSHSHHLFSPPENTNIMPLSTIETEVSQNFAFNSSSTHSIYGTSTGGSGTGNANINLLPFPQFYNNTIETAFVREASSSYNGLYVNGVQHMRGGITLIGSFTWSKSMDDGSSGSLDGITVDSFGFSYPQTPFTKVGEKSYSTYDIPTHTTAAYVWNIPVGRGTRFDLKNSVLNGIFGNLHNSGMFNAESGYVAWPTLGTVGYFTSNSATAFGGNGAGIATGAGGYNLRPNINPGVSLIRPNWRQDPFGLAGGGYLNPAAFSVPGSPGCLAAEANCTTVTANTPALGNSPRTLGARSPHTIYFDMSASKDVFFQRSERVKLTIRADAINAFNHTNFFLNPNSAHTLDSSINSTANYSGTTAPGAYVPSGTFGVCNSSNNNPGRTFAVGAAVTF